MIKAHSSGRMVSSGISDVVIASVYSEKTRLKKLMMMRIMMMMMMMMMRINRKETMVFSGRLHILHSQKMFESFKGEHRKFTL